MDANQSPRPFRKLAVALLGGLALLAPAVATGASDSNSRQTEVTITFRQCEFLLNEIIDGYDHLDSFVPETFQTAQDYGPGLASLGIWTWSCEEITLPNKVVRDVTMTMVSVHIVPPGADEVGPLYPGADHVVGYLAQWHYAVVAGFTNSGELAALIKSAGLPFEKADVTHEKALGDFEPIGIRHTSLKIEAAKEHFGVELDNYGHIGEHFHDQSFWGDNAADGVGELHYEVVDVTDAFCSREVVCTSVWADSGTLVAEMLRGTERTDAASYDHNPVASGVFTLTTHEAV